MPVFDYPVAITIKGSVLVRGVIQGHTREHAVQNLLEVGVWNQQGTADVWYPPHMIVAVDFEGGYPQEGE